MYKKIKTKNMCMSFRNIIVHMFESSVSDIFRRITESLEINICIKIIFLKKLEQAVFLKLVLSTYLWGKLCDSILVRRWGLGTQATTPMHKACQIISEADTCSCVSPSYQGKSSLFGSGMDTIC